MTKLLKKALRQALSRAGYDLVPAGAVAKTGYPPDFDQQASELCDFVKPYTMTSPERLIALRDAVEYVVRSGIPGDIVECGVWRGGSMMTVARTLLRCNAADRPLHLFDTFDGMPPPSGEDVDIRGREAAELLQQTEKSAQAFIWAFASLEDVQENMKLTGYPADLVHFVRGKVEETIPDAAPDKIALLRLDTDWFESTMHELVHLYPRLSPGGVLIIDDYGHWSGARKAVDRFIAENRLPLLLHRIDYTGRIVVKPMAAAAAHA